MGVDRGPQQPTDHLSRVHHAKITTNLPLEQWYHNSTDNDLQYWCDAQP